MKEYWLHITPETHVRVTHEDRKAFFVYGPLARNPNRSEEEEEQFTRLKEDYPRWYDRFLEMEKYNDYKRRLFDEAVLKGFWMRDAGMEITYYLPTFKSWRVSKKLQRHLQPHQSKPDWDNLYKAMADTLRPHQDNAIWHVKDCKKLWINEPVGRIHIICHDVPETIQGDPHQLKLKLRFTPDKRLKKPL